MENLHEIHNNCDIHHEMNFIILKILDPHFFSMTINLKPWGNKTNFFFEITSIDSTFIKHWDWTHSLAVSMTKKKFAYFYFTSLQPPGPSSKRGGGIFMNPRDTLACTKWSNFINKPDLKCYINLYEAWFKVKPSPLHWDECG